MATKSVISDGVQIRLAMQLIELGARRYDCVVGAVLHVAYGEFRADRLSSMLQADGLLADIKGMWRQLSLPAGIGRWQL